MKDTLYKFWVLKVRLRDWGFSNSVNNPSRPGSIRATNCRVFEPSNLDSERSKSQIITLTFLKSLISILVPMGSLRVNTSNFDIHSTQSSFKRTPVSTQNSLKKPQLRKVKIPSVKENSQSKCKTSKVVGLYISWIKFSLLFFYSFQLKSPAVVGGLGTSLTDIRQTNAESELELRGQIEVHIEPDDDSTRAKVRASLLQEEKCESARRKCNFLQWSRNKGKYNAEL